MEKCAQSYIGEDAFDVVILEYFPRVKEGLEGLAVRLRERFPDATIVFLELWYPRLMGVKRGEGCVFMDDWLKEKGFGIHLGTEQSGAVMASLKEEHLCWDQSAISFWMDEHEAIRQKVGAYLLKGPLSPWDLHTDPTALFWDEKSLFHEDMRHLSTIGHKALAHRLQTYLQHIQASPSNTLGTWGEGDSCASWFLNATQLPFRHTDGIVMNKFDTTNNKYALEIAPHGGVITVNNPFHNPRNLVLTYMAMGPTFTIYPKTLVSIAPNSNTSTHYPSQHTPIVVHPLTNGHLHFVHIALSKQVGKVQPGDNDVFLKSLETTDAPFRIVSIAVTASDESN